MSPINQDNKPNQAEAIGVDLQTSDFSNRADSTSLSQAVDSLADLLAQYGASKDQTLTRLREILSSGLKLVDEKAAELKEAAIGPNRELVLEQVKQLLKKRPEGLDKSSVDPELCAVAILGLDNMSGKTPLLDEVLRPDELAQFAKAFDVYFITKYDDSVYAAPFVNSERADRELFQNHEHSGKVIYYLSQQLEGETEFPELKAILKERLDSKSGGSLVFSVEDSPEAEKDSPEAERNQEVIDVERIQANW
jgi:hypothetical protein